MKNGKVDKMIKSDEKISGLRNCLGEVSVPVDTCRDSISRFSSETEQHRRVLQDTVVLSILEIKLQVHLKQFAVSLPHLAGS